MEESTRKRFARKQIKHDVKCFNMLAHTPSVMMIENIIPVYLLSKVKPTMEAEKYLKKLYFVRAHFIIG